ncbi:MAG: YHS domain-containing protein, partial [Terriglobales bacterium]
MTNVHKDMDSSGRSTDPVCGMSVDPETAAASSEFAGRQYFFCNPRCKEQFLAEPAKYIKPEPEPQPVAAGRGDAVRRP